MHAVRIRRERDVQMIVHDDEPAAMPGQGDDLSRNRRERRRRPALVAKLHYVRAPRERGPGHVDVRATGKERFVGQDVQLRKAHGLIMAAAGGGGKVRTFLPPRADRCSAVMRLLFATSIKTWGGGEEWMLSAATGLASRSHDVTLLGRPRSAIVKRARAAGLSVVETPFCCDADALSFLRTLRLCRKRDVQAVVLNMDRVLRVAGTAARVAGVRVVLPRRGSEFPLKRGPLYRWSYRRIATGVIVNSLATERTLCRDLPWRPAGRIRVLPNGVDVERFERTRPRSETRRALDLSEDEPVLIAVGELTTRKDPDALLDALSRLRTRGLRPWLLFAGEGAERPRLQRRAEELGLADRVRWLGFRTDVPDLLAAADLLVHAARVEGFGYAVAEAMAAGLPVVATNASSLPEIVVDGETGLLFPPGDADALAAAIEIYLTTPARGARDGARGRGRVHAEFSRSRRLEELEALLREEIEGSGRSSGP